MTTSTLPLLLQAQAARGVPLAVSPLAMYSRCAGLVSVAVTVTMQLAGFGTVYCVTAGLNAGLNPDATRLLSAWAEAVDTAGPAMAIAPMNQPTVIHRVFNPVIQPTFAVSITPHLADAHDARRARVLPRRCFLLFHMTHAAGRHYHRSIDFDVGCD
jgi:hypothetical protein